RRARGDGPLRPRARAARRAARRVTRRTWLAALGVAAAALVVGMCVTVAYALSTGFERAARQADLPDVLVRFDPARRAEVDARLRTLPGLEARSYRDEVTDVGLRAGGHATDRGAVHVVQGGRRGYAVVAGHDLRASRADVLVEPGLARAWGLRTLVGRAGGIVVALLVAFSLVALGAAAVMLGTAAHADVQRRLPALGVRRALGFSRRALAVAAARRAGGLAVPAALAGLALG